MSTEFTFLKATVSSILRSPARKWTAQGFGFLRTYFGPMDNPKKYRLNLWDSRFTVPNVSTIHDHPWDFTSLIIAGEFINQRYETIDGDKATHWYTTLKTGEGGGLVKDVFKTAILKPRPEELYYPGNIYSQIANEIHETKFKNGSVTINERIGDTEHARVFWPYGKKWVDAVPRSATDEEVETTIINSLKSWF